MFETIKMELAAALDSGQSEREELVEVIRQLPELEIFDSKMQYTMHHGLTFSYKDLACWLIERAHSVGVDEAIQNLNKYVVDKQYECLMVYAFSGIHVEDRIEIADSLALVPTWSIPRLPSSAATSNENLPTAALVQTTRFPILHMPTDAPRPKVHVDFSATERLEELAYLLGLVAEQPIVRKGRWETPADWVPYIGGAWAGRFFTTGRHQAQMPVRIPNDVIEHFTSLTAHLLAMQPANRTRLKVPIRRLHSAMEAGPKEQEDKAIDLGIAMESLFLPESSQGELGYQLRVRAARFLGETPDKRKEFFNTFRTLYELRSKAVHTGTLPPTHKSEATSLTLSKGIRLTLSALEKVIIADGEIDWTELTLG